MIYSIFLHRSKRFNIILFTFACPGHLNQHHIKTVIKKLPFSSWLFLYYLAKNMDTALFKQFLKELADEIEARGDESSSLLKKNGHHPPTEENEYSEEKEKENNLPKKRVAFQENDNFDKKTDE